MAIRQRIMGEASGTFHIDQDLGQLRTNTRPPVSWPCVLIDFEDFRFENLGENVQTAKGTVVFQLGFAPHSNSSQATPAPRVLQAMGYYQHELTLHRILQGWSPTAMSGSLIRTSAITQKRNDHYRVRELRYSLEFEDYSTKLQQGHTRARLVLTDDIVLPV